MKETVLKLEAIDLVQNGDINLSTGVSKHDTKWKNKTMLWSEFLDRLGHPTQTQETVAEYHKMSKAKRDITKDVGGFVGGFLKQGRRKATNVQSRSLITLDADSVKTDLWDDMNLLADYCIAMYTTHSHTPQAPRYRFIIPLARPVTPDEYEPIARKIAEAYGIDNFDDTTYQAERLMFWPSYPRDGEYRFELINEQWLDPDTVLDQYIDWTDTSYWPESSRSKGIRKRQIEKQGDPLEKPGVIGAFCRVYDIHQAIEEFLPETYLATDKPDRYTYAEGSTAGGLVLYDDKFAYSHHSTDPVGDSLVNAFDLVRIHKFGDLDDGVAPTTNTSKYPSYKAMQEFAISLGPVKLLIVKERYESAQSDFEDVEIEESDKEWMATLEFRKNGEIVPSASNLEIIFRNDPNLKGRVYLDTFAKRVTLKKDLEWRKIGHEKFWKDSDDAGLRIYIEKTYGINASGKIEDALMQEMERNTYHPVKEYLESLKWDGTKRVDTVLIDYLGAEDCEYTRIVTRKFLAAAVARIYRPGVKFDSMLVTTGPQGIGKTLLPGKLAGEWFSNSLEDVRGKDAMDSLQGVWIMEMGEMTATKKADVEATKHFISKQEDIFRAAYGKHKSYYKRQVVFWGTSNDSEFLRDRTGNRRFWPVEVGLKSHPITKKVWEMSNEERDQIWAEAKAIWEGGEKLYLNDKEEALAKEVQALHTEQSPMQGKIEDFLDIPITDDWYLKTEQERREYIQSFGDTNLEKGTVLRDKVSVIEIWNELFCKGIENIHPAKANEIKSILENLPGWEKHKTGRGQLRFGTGYGRQVAYLRTSDELI